MQDAKFLYGGLATTTGLCPVCGLECKHVHGWTLTGMHDTYACGGCGVTEYRVVESAS